MPGLLDFFNDPNSQQMLGLASGLLSAGGPQPFPTSVGQGLSQGLLTGSKFRSAAQQAQLHEQQLISAILANKMAGYKGGLWEEEMRGGQPSAGAATTETPAGFSPSSSQLAFGTPEFATAPQSAPAQPQTTRGGLPLIPGYNQQQSLMAHLGMLAPGAVSAVATANAPSDTARLLREAGIPIGGSAGQAAVTQKLTPSLVPRGFPIQRMNPITGEYEADPSSVRSLLDFTQKKAAIEQPFKAGMTEVPVYLPGGDQVTVKLNPVQMTEYNRTGQLPPEIAASIPGYQQPTTAATPDVTVSPSVSPEQIARIPDPIARQTAWDAYVKQQNMPKPAGRPVVGRGRTESEQITQKRQEAGGKATDEQFAKDYVAFTTGGGAQDATKQMAQLQDVITALKTEGAQLTGPWMGSTPDAILKFKYPNAIAMRERVEEVVQRSLRAILGAQFTEKEGERLIARAYNPNQPEAENAIRVQRLFTQLSQGLESKSDAAAYFERNGTLQGWRGKLPSINDFDPAKSAVEGKITPPAPAGALSEAEQKELETLRARFKKRL